MRNKASVFILIFVLITAVFTVSKFVNFRKITKTADAEFQLAPDFSLFDVYGRKRNLSDFKGKVIILDFWATWCPPCRFEIPHFVELYEEYREKGLEIIGVSLDLNKAKVEAFIEENGVNYPVLMGDRDVTELYGGIVSIPTTFILDRDGVMRKRYIGYRDKEVFESDIKQFL